MAKTLLEHVLSVFLCQSPGIWTHLENDACAFTDWGEGDSHFPSPGLSFLFSTQ